MKTNLLKTNLLILALLLISSGLMAQNRIWAPGGDRKGTGLWSDPANWEGSNLPGTDFGDRAIFRGGEAFIDSDVSPQALGLSGNFRLELGDLQEADVLSILVIEKDGYLKIDRPDERTEIGIWNRAKLIIEEGGELYFEGKEFIIASSKGSATQNFNAAGTEVHINGGTMTIRGVFGIDYFNDKVNSGGTIFMNGGLLDLNMWTVGNMEDVSSTQNQSIGKNGKIDYKDGLIKIAGNYKTSLEWMKEQGRITGDFEIWVEQTITGTDTTYVTKLSNEAPDVDPLTDATLSDLTLSEGTLSPAFAATINDYTAELAVGTTATPTVTATPTNANATVVVTDATDVTSADVADRTTTIEVTAEDGVTELTYTVVFNISTTSVNDLAIGNLIYPNPASSRLYISHDVKIDRVEIYNITGSRVLSLNNFTSNAIDISDLNAGLYIISVTDVNNSSIVRKFVKE